MIVVDNKRSRGPLEALGALDSNITTSESSMDKYHVMKAIGKGKFSVVHQGYRVSDNLPVAIKKVVIGDILDSKMREKCLKEVRLIQSLSHPQIISYLDSFLHESDLIIVFEWAEAGDLKKQIKKAIKKDIQFEERVVWKYFYQMCEAVRYMHDNRVMHRDLKPANIFLTADARIKVGDLGLGRAFSENTMEAFSKVGTPLYMSPEVLRGNGYEWSSDIWSLGCILYELAMLRSPFKEEGLNLYGLFQKISRGVYAPISDSYSIELRNLTASMLTIDPKLRPEISHVCKVAGNMLRRFSTVNTKVASLPLHRNRDIDMIAAGISTQSARQSHVSDNQHHVRNESYNNNNNSESHHHSKYNSLKKEGGIVVGEAPQSVSKGATTMISLQQKQQDREQENSGPTHNDNNFGLGNIVANAAGNNMYSNTAPKAPLAYHEGERNSSNSAADVSNVPVSKNSLETNNVAPVAPRAPIPMPVDWACCVTMHGILEKLKLLNYEVDYCKVRNAKPFSCTTFVAEGQNTFLDFMHLCDWLLNVLAAKNNSESSESGVHDSTKTPMVLASSLLSRLQKNDIQWSTSIVITAHTLVSGRGAGVCHIIDAVLDKILLHRRQAWGEVAYGNSNSRGGAGGGCVDEENIDLLEVEELEEGCNSMGEDCNTSCIDIENNDRATTHGNINGSTQLQQVDPVAWKCEYNRVKGRLWSKDAPKAESWRCRVDVVVSSIKCATSLEGVVRRGAAAMVESLKHDLGCIKKLEEDIAPEFTKVFTDVNAKIRQSEAQVQDLHDSISELTSLHSALCEEHERSDDQLHRCKAYLEDAAPLRDIKAAIEKITNDIYDLNMQVAYSVNQRMRRVAGGRERRGCEGGGGLESDDEEAMG